jgi:hypothetical protein
LNKGVAQRFHQLFPTSELFLVPGARHFVQMDEPAQVARLILDMSRAGSDPRSATQQRAAAYANASSLCAISYSATAQSS